MIINPQRQAGGGHGGRPSSCRMSRSACARKRKSRPNLPQRKRPHRRALSAGRSDRPHRAPLCAKTLRSARPDLIARVGAQNLPEALAHQFYDENVSGATGARGAAMVAAAPADGQTLLFVTHDLAVTSTISSKLQYDPIKSFAPVGLVSSSPSVVLVHPSVPAKTLQELIQLARADPAKYSFASMSLGRIFSLARSSSGSG